MRPAIEFPDIELWLAAWLRARLPAGTFVSNYQPREDDEGQPLPSTRHVVIVRDDSGPDDQFTALRRVGIRDLCPADADDNGAMARRIAALLRTAATTESDNPVASVGPVFGPHRIPAEGDRPERYLTVELTIVGQPFNPTEGE